MQRASARLLNLRKSVLKCTNFAIINEFKAFSSLHGVQGMKRVNNDLLIKNSITLTNSYRFYSSNLPEHVLIRLPALSPTMEQGTIAKWCKKEGDEVQEGDLIAEIETDKATMGLESSEEGFIAKILVPEKAKDIPLKTLLCVMVKDKADIEKFANFTGTEESSTPRTTTPTPTPQAASSESTQSLATAQPESTTQQTGRVFATPFAKKIAEEKGVDLKGVQGTGPDNQIRANDVLSFSASAPAAAPTPVSPPPPPSAPTQPQAQVQPTGKFNDIQLTNMRNVIAKRLLQSKTTIPHYYLTIDLELDNALKMRKEFNDQLTKENVKISVTDIIVKAAALACKKVPEANSAWMDTFIRQYTNVDVNVAVATENGLITPIIFNADKKGLTNINSDLATLAQKARSNKLAPNEFQGGTFTVSNLGMYGIKSFSAVINPPQSCILAVGGTEKRLVPGENGSPRVATMMYVTLSCDHRVVDGAVGAKWLEYFKKYMENPMSMLL